MRILVLNGPNLNLLGKRQPEIYGSQQFDDFLHHLQNQFPDVELLYYQSNVEGELVNKIQEYGFGESDGIILNAASYTHTSVAIADAIAAIEAPVIEVHISNVYTREEFRHKSMLAPYCEGIITGFGLASYTLALVHLISKAS